MWLCAGVFIPQLISESYANNAAPQNPLPPGLGTLLIFSTLSLPPSSHWTTAPKTNAPLHSHDNRTGTETSTARKKKKETEKQTLMWQREKAGENALPLSIVVLHVIWSGIVCLQGVIRLIAPCFSCQNGSDSRLNLRGEIVTVLISCMQTSVQLSLSVCLSVPLTSSGAHNQSKRI